MAISSLDTLDIAKRLKEAGFSEPQAEAVTGVFREVRTADLANLATKADIERLEASILRLEAATKADIERLEASILRLEAATKADIERLEATAKTDFQRPEAATKADIERLEAATKADFQRLEAATKTDFQRLEDKMEIMRRDMTIRLGGMIVAATAILLAAKFFG